MKKVEATNPIKGSRQKGEKTHGHETRRGENWHAEGPRPSSHLNRASPSTVENYIKGIHFPASKENLIEQAKQNEAPNEVLNILKRFSEHLYNSALEVAKETGRADREVE